MQQTVWSDILLFGLRWSINRSFCELNGGSTVKTFSSLNQIRSTVNSASLRTFQQVFTASHAIGLRHLCTASPDALQAKIFVDTLLLNTEGSCSVRTASNFLGVLYDMIECFFEVRAAVGVHRRRPEMP